MDEELRTQKDCFDKTNIESEELFNKCTKVLNELEDDNQEFCSSMESLLQIYGDAGRNVNVSPLKIFQSLTIGIFILILS